jgi:hypothetical protein
MDEQINQTKKEGYAVTKHKMIYGRMGVEL